MTLFKLLSQGRAVELRAAQQMLVQFARLKSSQPIESFGSSLIDRPTLGDRRIGPHQQLTADVGDRASRP
jgi:hypothetical protein